MRRLFLHIQQCWFRGGGGTGYSSGGLAIKPVEEVVVLSAMNDGKCSPG